MILNKLAKGIRRQDWSTVFVEVVVVVVGIFIGLQVDDWNSERVALKAEEEYLQQLAREIDDNRETYRRAEEASARDQQFALDYYDFIKGERRERPDEHNLLRMLCHLGFVSPIPYDNSVLDEMKASGMLARLQSQELRTALARYVSQQKRWDQLIFDSSEDFKGIFRFVDRFRTWVPADEKAGFANCTIDFDALESHERTLHHIANLQRFAFWQRRAYRWIGELLAAVRAFLPPVTDDGKAAGD